MEIINTTAVIDYLNSKGIDTSNIEDTTISSKINTYLNYLLSLIGISLDEEEHVLTDIQENVLEDEYYLLPYYPVTSIEYIKTEDNTIDPNDYLLDKENGIIRWKDAFTLYADYLEIKYKSQLNTTNIIPLLNIIIQDLIYDDLNPEVNKDVSTLKEGDVSITYDRTNSTSNRINSNIEALKNMCSGLKVRLL